jgi:hypothetical protein
MYPEVTIQKQRFFHPQETRHFVVREEVPIRVGSPQGGSHEGGSPSKFLTNGEHMSMGTSTYVVKNKLITKKICCFSFIYSFLLVFL